jgi:class 3 adenylate cyclase
MSPRRDGTVLVTVLFTDIVGSTEIAAELGDARWRALVLRHHAVVRGALKRFGGKELDTAGDGFFARFDRPADAIRCASAISDGVRELGIEIRAGLHVGEVELLDGKVGGFAVNVGARVMGAGKAGEVLVSSTLRDAVAGSRFEFADHGVHQLKGIDGEWRLFEVIGVDGVRRMPPLGAEEARERRQFVQASPAQRWSARAVVGAAVTLMTTVIVALVALNGSREAGSSTDGLDDGTRALRALVPDAIRASCLPATSSPPDAVAGLECHPDETYSVSYARFRTPDEMQAAFEGFASPADLTKTDCATEASARHEYTINGVSAGEVACYTVEGDSISTSDSVIAWTDNDLLVLGRAMRGDTADRTLYDWWRTETGPWAPDSSAHPPKGDEGPAVLRGAFETASGRDRTLLFEEGRYQDSWFAYAGDAEPFFAKPSTVLIFHEQPPPGGATGLCPNYEDYRWQLRGDRLDLELVSGGCREYGSREIDEAGWERIG